MQTAEQLLAMEPMQLIEVIQKDFVFQIPETLDSPVERRIASDTITRATALNIFYASMETQARIRKRAAKAAKLSQQEQERLHGLEEVFKVYKEGAKSYIDNIAKMMTLKRLELDEQKNNRNIT